MNIYRVCGRKCPARRGACVTGTVCVRHVAPYHTVQYRTVPHRVLPCSRNTRQSISYPVSLKESQGERKPLWETGENVENSVESVWRTCFKALRPVRAGAGAAGSLMGTFGRAWSGGGAAVDRGGARGRGCGGADAGSGGGRARRSMGQCRQGDVRVRCWLAAGCGLARAFGRVRSGGCFRPVRVWWTPLAGALWRPCGAGRGCSAGRAGLLSYREKNA